MGSLIRHITVGCRDHYTLMQFWREALEDYHDHPEDPNKPEDEQSGLVGPPGSPWMLFVPVPEDKSVKNRLHLDIAPVDRTRDEWSHRLRWRWTGSSPWALRWSATIAVRTGVAGWS